MDWQKERIHATDAQRSRYESCDGTAAQARDRRHTMAGNAAGSNRDIPALSREKDHVRKQIQTLDRDMQQLREGLTEEQKEQLQSRLQALDREREQLRVHQQSLDGELDSSAPNTARLANRTRQVEQAMERWQKRYQDLGKDLGIPED
jgi:chromosome segregation ATPase